MRYTKTKRESENTEMTTVNNARKHGKSDEYAKAVGGFAVAQMSDGTFDYFPSGQPANVNGDIDRNAKIVEKWTWNYRSWKQTA